MYVCVCVLYVYVGCVYMYVCVIWFEEYLYLSVLLNYMYLHNDGVLSSVNASCPGFKRPTWLALR